MPRQTHESDAQLSLFAVNVHIPTVKIPQPDGSLLIKAGKPVIQEQEIGTMEAAKILGMSQRWIINECNLGNFATAYQPAGRVKSSWKIARSEVLSRRNPGSATA